MALIACPECSREISDRAPSCPYCGSPRVVPITHASDLIHTIEATGKNWKLVQLAGAVGIILGLVTCTGVIQPDVAESTAHRWGVASGWLWFVGLSLFIIGRVGAWWHHG